MTADQYMIEILEGASVPGEITVVTDDRSLQRLARSLGAKTLSLKAFCVLLEKRRKQKDPGERKLSKESKREFDRLLSVFQKMSKE